jgi:CBS domain-containing protein
MTASPAPTAGPRSVGEIMSHPAVTATADETVAVAADRMHEQAVGSVVVVDGERPIGILTERDLVRVAGAGADPTAARVGEWMTPNPDSVASSTPAQAAYDSLALHV